MQERVTADYSEHAADPRLADALVCLWTQTIPKGQPYPHPILPDACVDIVFIGDERAIVAGPATLPVLAELPPGAMLVGARFRPGAAPSWLGTAAHELQDLDVPLRDLWGSTADVFAERLSAAATPDARRALLEAELISRLPRAREGDLLVDCAVAALARPDAPDVGTLSRSLFLSERQLLRRFRERVGYGPKTLQRILRMQRFLLLAQDRTRTLAACAQAAGYADQAHMAREVRQLAGQLPHALARRGAGTLRMSDLFKQDAVSKD